LSSIKSGRVAYAVLSAGGIAGIGDKWLAVPPTVFTRTGTDKALTWDINKEKLQAAPTIDKRNWNAALQQDYIGTVYSYYGVQGYNQESDLNEPAGSQKKDTQFHHDSEQQDKQDKQDKQDQSRLNSSSSDLQGQAAGASTQSSEQSEALKSQPEKSASASADVSKEAAGAQSEKSASSSADVSKEAAGAQSSSSSSSIAQPESSSTDVNAPAGAASSSSSAAPSKTYSTDPQSSATSSQDNSSSVSEPAGAASSSATTSSDTASGSVVNKVQMALKNDASLSGSTQNVQFSMQEEKLVIKGTVKSQDEKNRILEKVRASAGSTQIDDQLKVDASSDSDSSSSSEQK